jgi:hypothetical protein
VKNDAAILLPQGIWWPNLPNHSCYFHRDHYDLHHAAVADFAASAATLVSATSACFCSATDNQHHVCESRSSRLKRQLIGIMPLMPVRHASYANTMYFSYNAYKSVQSVNDQNLQQLEVRAAMGGWVYGHFMYSLQISLEAVWKQSSAGLLLMMRAKAVATMQHHDKFSY